MLLKKNKNRRVRSAVHRAVSIRKLDSLPVNHPKPKIKVGIFAEHLRDAYLKTLNYTFIKNLTERVGGVKTPTIPKKSDRLSTTVGI